MSHTRLIPCGDRSKQIYRCNRPQPRALGSKRECPSKMRITMAVQSLLGSGPFPQYSTLECRTFVIHWQHQHRGCASPHKVLKALAALQTQRMCWLVNLTLLAIRAHTHCALHPPFVILHARLAHAPLTVALALFVEFGSALVPHANVQIVHEVRRRIVLGPIRDEEFAMARPRRLFDIDQRNTVSRTAPTVL